jgi:hypothetical protein
MVAPGKMLGADSDEGPLTGIQQFQVQAMAARSITNFKASSRCIGSVKG